MKKVNPDDYTNLQIETGDHFELVEEGHSLGVFSFQREENEGHIHLWREPDNKAVDLERIIEE